MGINAQVTELREALTDQKTAVSEAAQRVLDKVASLEAKVTELGEVDPDIASDIADIRSETEAIKGIAAEPAPEPEPEPTPGPEDNG